MQARIKKIDVLTNATVKDIHTMMRILKELEERFYKLERVACGMD
jgi:hypothetical protein